MDARCDHAMLNMRLSAVATIGAGDSYYLWDEFLSLVFIEDFKSSHRRQKNQG
jgi:hypothetical protein